MENLMFCYQCQETAGCTGCTKMGVCGKNPQVAAMQDLLVWASKGISEITTRLRKEGKEVSKDVNHLITLNLFTTITNANFDDEAIVAKIQETLDARNELLNLLDDKTGLSEAATWNADKSEWDAKARTVGVLSTENEDVRSLRELVTYGLKGLSAYSKHANVLREDDVEVDAFLQRALAATLDDTLSADDLVALTLETGKYGVSGMAMLDKANTSTYGNPEVTSVNIGVGKNQIIIKAPKRLNSVDIKTMPYPGFPTDMQSIFATLLTTAKGSSIIVENIFENRYKYTQELIRMGAKISVEGKTAIIKGLKKLYGANVKATDLRGGAALVMAATTAKGITKVENIDDIKKTDLHKEEEITNMAGNNGQGKPEEISVNSIKENYPEIYNEIRNQAITEERNRMIGIDEIAETTQNKELVNTAKKDGKTKEQLALDILNYQSTLGQVEIAKMQVDSEGIEKLETIPPDDKTSEIKNKADGLAGAMNNLRGGK